MYRTAGFLSYALRRFTGVALVLYLFLHMWVIGSINQGPEVFDARLALVQTTFFKFLEIALLAAVAYHAFDGLRLLIVDWFSVTAYKKSAAIAAFVVAALVTIAGGVPILLFALEK